MNYSKKERDKYNISRERSCTRLNITKNQYNWIRRKGAELQKLYEDNCNGLFNEELDYQKAVDPLYKAVEDYIGRLGLFVYFQTDPRGATIYTDREPIPDNNYTIAVCIF